MTELLIIGIVGFVISYIGSIPPGTLNLTVMQYAMTGQRRAAILFALAAGLVEFFYAGAAVKFQQILSQNLTINTYFQVITASVLMILGLVNLLKKAKTNPPLKRVDSGRNGFKRGLILSLLNPLAIPFWLAVSATLYASGLGLGSNLSIVVFVTGISLGTTALLYHLTILGGHLDRWKNNSFLIYKVPGLILLSLSVYTFYGLI